MAESNFLSSRVKAGEIIRPWLMLGPFYEDLSARVQGLTLYERPGATVGQAAMIEIVEDARPILVQQPVEGQAQRYRGKEAFWNLVRSPEKYLSWGTYNISNHLGAAFLSTILTPEQAGRRRLRLIQRITERGVVYINGSPALDTADCAVQPVQGVYEYEFEADLQAGENVVTVGLFRLARMAQVGMRLEVLDSDVTARVAPVQSISAECRAAVEEELTGIRLARDIFYPEHDFGFHLAAARACGSGAGGARLEVLLSDEQHQCLRVIHPTQAGPVTICKAADLADGHYTIHCRWLGPDGAPFSRTEYFVHKLTPKTPPAGFDKLAERKHLALVHYANLKERDQEKPISVQPLEQVLEPYMVKRNYETSSIWPEVARYALGCYNEVDEHVIRETCLFINARKDCSDFVIQGLLRLMYWERAEQHLSPEINAMMKDTVLNFKYWVDEPGDTVMYMGSENHRLLFHVAEWMAGHLYPTETFTNSGQNGLYHTAKAYVYITEWLRQRGRFGFDEWHSNSYFPICLAPLFNLYDFSTHEGYYKLRQMTAAILDQMLFYMAADAYQGIFGTTHGRSYGVYVKYPDFEGTSATNWLFFGTGSLSYATSGMSPVCAATSDYQLPRILYDIANDQNAVVEAKRRQGILRTSLHHADFAVYRTPDYLLSGLQDHRKGEFESSTHVEQVTLGKKNVIFWSCPHTTGEGSGLRPDYWSGNTSMPRVIQHRNVMSVTYRLSRFAWMSHCFFEQEKFDEVRFAGRWAFARVADGYVGIYSENGLEVGQLGQYAGRELQCGAEENTWLVECGRKADWGSFEAFVEALSAAPVTSSGGVITYVSPSVGPFVTGWDVQPSVNGQPVELRGRAMVDSPWAQAEFGSGEMVIRYGDQEYELWFNQ
jgi:hypothetical protein